MLVTYKIAAPEAMQRILAWCRANTVQNGGPFEVYSDPENKERVMVIVNSNAVGVLKEYATSSSLTPLGVFYCNYQGPGAISFDDDPRHDRAESRKHHAAALKQVIDALLDDARRI